MMRRFPNSTIIPVTVTAVIAALVLTACSPKAAEDIGSSDKELTIAFVPGIASDPFFKAMQLGAEEAAADLGVNLVWQGSSKEYSPQSQVPFVDAVLAEDIDGLILVPTDPDALMPSVDKAVAQGLPVITVDTTVTDDANLTSHITGDNVQGGKQAAHALAEQIGGKGKVFLMMGSPTGTTNILREQGFMEGLADFPDIEFVGREYAYSQSAKATSAINTVLLKHPDLAGIFAIDGTSSTGAVAALRNSGRVGDVKLVGYDAYTAQVEALEEGVFTALIAQQPALEAKMALEYMVAKIRGKGADEIEAKVVVENILITKENLDETAEYVYAE